jgi:hypothetical protein
MSGNSNVKSKLNNKVINGGAVLPKAQP